jgi:hypothetical protein
MLSDTAMKYPISEPIMRKVLTITLASVLAVLAAQTSSHAAEPFDGLWATSRKDCRDKDGPDSKTFIDLDNVIKGKPAPLVDQYENHCRVDRKTPAGDGLVLNDDLFRILGRLQQGRERTESDLQAFTRAKGHAPDRWQALFALQAQG